MHNELGSELPLLVYTKACLEGGVVERCELVFGPYVVWTVDNRVVWDITLPLASGDRLAAAIVMTLVYLLY